MTIGRKDDTGKLRWGLLRKSCVNALEGVIRVLMFGAKKYGDDNWKDVADAQRRYRDALDRHLADLDRGVEFDPDTGEDNWAHVATNAIFVLQLREEQRAKKAETPANGTVVPTRPTRPGRALRQHWPACGKPIALSQWARVSYTTRSGYTGTACISGLCWGKLPGEEGSEIIEWSLAE